MVDLNVQVLILLYSLLSGLIFGFCFDVYRILFKIKEKNILEFLMSILFWIIVGGVVFYILLNTQYAVLSFYTYFYIFLGVLIYIKLISKFIYGVLKNILYVISLVLRVVFKNIIYIFSRIFLKKTL